VQPELVLDLVEVTVFVHETQQRADEGREAARQPVDSAAVERAKPSVGEQPEIAWVRVGVQEAGPRRAREQETGDHDAGRFRSAFAPPAMLLASGVPSIHSLTSTWSVTATTCGTQTSGSPAYAAAKG